MSGKGNNVVLIGMPGAGKSTMGVLLAKRLNRAFIDTDLELQRLIGRSLRETIDARGFEAFLDAESNTVQRVDAQAAVIATGGSVVYRPAAMDHLKKNGAIVFLDVPLEVLQRRLESLASRGVVIGADQTLGELFAERIPLYRRYADLVVPCDDDSHEIIVNRVLDQLERRRKS